METIYFYGENTSNLIVFTVFLAIIILLIAIACLFFPLLKRCVLTIYTGSIKSNEAKCIPSKKDLIKVISITAAVYLIVLVGLVCSFNLLWASRFKWINTDIDLCLSVSGKAENVEFNTIERRGEIIRFETNFSVADVDFYVDIPASQKKAITYLANHYPCIVYYQSFDEKLVVVRIDVFNNRVDAAD